MWQFKNRCQFIAEISVFRSFGVKKERLWELCLSAYLPGICHLCSTLQPKHWTDFNQMWYVEKNMPYLYLKIGGNNSEFGDTYHKKKNTKL